MVAQSRLLVISTCLGKRTFETKLTADSYGRMPIDAGSFDQVDLKILEYIEQDYDVDHVSIADELGLSSSTVNSRIRKLKSTGVIQEISADVDPKAVGLDVVAILEISVRCDDGDVYKFIETLAEIGSVEQIYPILGYREYVIILRLQSFHQLFDRFRKIVNLSEVDDVFSMLVGRPISEDGNVLSNLPTNARNDLLDTR